MHWTSVSTTGDITPLTVERLMEIRRQLTLAASLLYAVHEAVPADKVFKMEETDMSHAFYIFHDQETAERIAAEMNLQPVHIRDAPRKVFWKEPKL